MGWHQCGPKTVWTAGLKRVVISNTKPSYRAVSRAVPQGSMHAWCFACSYVHLLHKWCKGRHRPPPTSRPMRSHSVSNSYFRKYLWCYCWAWRYMVWNIPWVSLGQLSWQCPLPAPCPPPAHSLGEQHEKWEGLDAAKTSVCYQHCCGYSHRSETQHHMGYCEENEL